MKGHVACIKPQWRRLCIQWLSADVQIKEVRNRIWQWRMSQTDNHWPALLLEAFLSGEPFSVVKKKKKNGKGGGAVLAKRLLYNKINHNLTCAWLFQTYKVLFYLQMLRRTPRCEGPSSNTDIKSNLLLLSAAEYCKNNKSYSPGAATMLPHFQPLARVQFALWIWKRTF